MASSVVGPRRSSKALPKAKLEPKKRSWSPFDGPLLVWSYSSFLNLRETITSEKYAQQIEEMHQKLQSLQPALINRKGPILFYNNARLHIARPMLQKWNELGCEVLPRLPYSPDLSPADHHVLKHINFVQGICFHNQQDSENAFQEFIKSQSIDFYALGINKLISHWQKCVDCNGSYFDF